MDGTNPFYSKTTKSKSNLGDQVFDIMYLVGSFTMARYERLTKNLINSSIKLLYGIKDSFFALIKRILSFFKSSFFDFLEIFKKAVYRYNEKKEALLQTKGKAVSTSILIAINGGYEIVKVIFTLMLALIKIIAPVVAVFILVNIIGFFLDSPYAVEVKLGNEVDGYTNLGYIKDESIFEIAQKELQEDIEYQEGEEFIYTTPTFSVVMVGEDELYDATTLREKIIKASGAEISEAYGFYVDGKFQGAVENKTMVENLLNETLSKYKAENENATVNFLQDVKFEKKVYLKGSIREEQDILSLVSTEKEANEIYIVEAGDTPSGVASNLSMRLAELQALNPNLQDDFKPGKELLIKSSKPFLSVKSTVVETYKEEIAFLKESSEDSKEYKGISKVTQEGENGVAEVVAEIVMVDGVKIDQIELSREILEEPVTEKTSVGTKSRAASGSVSVSSGTIPASSGQFKWPVASGGRVTNGWYGYAGHAAIDIQSFLGDAILAADAGVVTTVSYSRYGYGYHVIITHSNGFQTLYAHNSSISVVPGQQVSKGQVIAAQGRTGNASGVHVHFEIIHNGRKVNPMGYF